MEAQERKTKSKNIKSYNRKKTWFLNLRKIIQTKLI